MPQVSENTNIRDWYYSNFRTFESGLNGQSESDFHKIRKHAIEQFKELGFPTLDNEDWKYTNIAPILKFNFIPAQLLPGVELTRKDIEKYLIKDLNASVLVFINGHLRKDLSGMLQEAEGIQIEEVQVIAQDRPELIREFFLNGSKDGFTALNTAFAGDGVVINVPEGLVVENPLYLLFLSGSDTDNVLIQPRNIIIAGKNSQVKVIESYHSISEKPYLANIITQIKTEESAVVSYYKIQAEADAAFHISTTKALQLRSSTLNTMTVTTGGSLVRNELDSVLGGEYAGCTFQGLYLAGGKRHIDNHTLIDHAVPNCQSNELYKGILDEKSRGVFNGKVVVRKDAQKTQAYQSNKNLLLSRYAKVDTKPQLEIFADDVKCSHGATVGQLNEESVFYLRSRGVGEEKARSLLMNAFASDVIDSITIEPLRETLNNQILERLQQKAI